MEHAGDSECSSEFGMQVRERALPRVCRQKVPGKCMENLITLNNVCRLRGQMDHWIGFFKTKSFLSLGHSQRKNKMARSRMFKEVNGLHRWLRNWHPKEKLAKKENRPTLARKL